MGCGLRELLGGHSLLSLNRGAVRLKFWKTKGELNLGPEKRRLIIWGMSAPIVTALASILFAPIPHIGVFAILFGFLSALGNVVVIPWGLYNLSRINEEPYDFISSVRTMLVLNTAFLLCFVSFAGVIAMELAND